MMPETIDDDDDIGVDYNPEEEAPSTPAGLAKQRHEDELFNLPGVEGVGLGQNAIGNEAIVLYVRDKSAASRLPKQIDGIDIVSEVTGEIDAY